jgi:hypothetical protein
MDLYDDYGNTMQAFPAYSMEDAAPIVSKMLLNQKEGNVCEDDNGKTQMDLVILKGERIIALSPW